MRNLFCSSKPIDSVIGIVLLLASIAARCPERTAARIDETFNVICEPCPSNCMLCYVGIYDKNICTFCEEGYMLDDDLNCQACADNCWRCDGPTIEHCHTLKNGYFLNEKTKKAEKCAENCNRCFGKDKCVSCAEGFYPSDKRINDNKVLEVTCSPCNEPHCVYCNVKSDQANNTYTACNYCEPKYTVVNGKCEACPENCKYCKPETMECTFCENGYFLNKNTNICEAVPIPNCYSMSGDKCMMCEAHFYLEDGACALCAKKQANCTYCTTKAENFLCLSCKSGYYKAKDDSCKPCPDRCVHCSEEKCFSCEHKYFYNADARECQLCEIENCETCYTSTICSQCKSGYFFDPNTKKCQK